MLILLPLWQLNLMRVRSFDEVHGVRLDHRNLVIQGEFVTLDFPADFTQLADGNRQFLCIFVIFKIDVFNLHQLVVKPGDHLVVGEEHGYC